MKPKKYSWEFLEGLLALAIIASACAMIISILTGGGR